MSGRHRLSKTLAHSIYVPYLLAGSTYNRSKIPLDVCRKMYKCQSVIIYPSIFTVIVWHFLVTFDVDCLSCRIKIQRNE